MFRLTHWDDVPFRAKLGIPVASALTLGVCLVLWLFPSMAGDCLSNEEEQVFAYLESAQFSPALLSSYKAALSGLRHDILSADALRSALFILGGIVLLWIYAEDKIKNTHLQPSTLTLKNPPMGLQHEQAHISKYLQQF